MDAVAVVTQPCPVPVSSMAGRLGRFLTNVRWRNVYSTLPGDHGIRWGGTIGGLPTAGKKRLPRLSDSRHSPHRGTGSHCPHQIGHGSVQAGLAEMKSAGRGAEHACCHHRLGLGSRTRVLALDQGLQQAGRRSARGGDPVAKPSRQRRCVDNKSARCELKNVARQQKPKK
jgi:hypothetical protein